MGNLYRKSSADLLETTVINSRIQFQFLLHRKARVYVIRTGRGRYHRLFRKWLVFPLRSRSVCFYRMIVPGAASLLVFGKSRWMSEGTDERSIDRLVDFFVAFTIIRLCAPEMLSTRTPKCCFVNFFALQSADLCMFLNVTLMFSFLMNSHVRRGL